MTVSSVGFHSDKKLWSHVTKQQLRDALNDPRIPDDADFMPTVNYPGLAILHGESANEYLGYIDLFDGEVVIHDTPGVRDGKNPLTNDAIGDEAPAFYSSKWVGAR